MSDAWGASSGVDEEPSMSTIISDRTRNHLFHSLSAVETHKEAVIEAMASSLAASEPHEQPSAHARTTAMLLVNMLVQEARHLIQKRDPEELELHIAEHELHGIAGRHYSRFGDALIPVLRDAIGPGLSKTVAAAWCDAFWAIIGMMQQQEAEAGASQRRALA
jgi:hemoglobin-like flavoprotein